MTIKLRRWTAGCVRLGQWLRRPMWIFITACLLRTAVIGTFFAHNHFIWERNEPAGIARSIVEGHGFSSAFHDASGPTAWVAPVYPALLAAIFHFFGIETAASAVMAVLFNVIVSSLTAVLLLRLGREQLGETAGVIAGWAWAMSPSLLFMPWLLWETCLSALVLTFGILTLLSLGNSSKLRNWAWCGSIWSFGALLNPAILGPLAVLSAEAVIQSRRLKGPALMLGVCVLGVLPWTARNYRAFGCIVPIRSNFWPEAYFGNVDFSLHPSGNAMVYQKEGEIQFARDLKGRTLNFIRSNSRQFVHLVGRRMGAFWGQASGMQPYPLLLLAMSMGGIVVAWRRRKRWAAFASVVVVYPIVYYITYVFARYRYPIEPLMYALSAYFICELVAGGKRWRAQSETKLIGMEKPRYKAPGVAMQGRR